MKPIQKLPLLLLAITLFAAPALADAWLHVRVEEHRGDGEKISINVPLGIVETMLPHISSNELRHGKLRIDRADWEGLDLREIIDALVDAPDSDFLTVRGGDETVRVAKEDRHLVLHVDERRGSRSESVRVRMPMAVVEALVAADDDELDLVAAVRVLRDFQGEDLLQVEWDDESIRVWIDSSESGD